MNTQGILTKNEHGVWVVKWSDLHTFSEGWIWSYTELSAESNSIKSVKDNVIVYEPLEEGLTVEFELVTTCCIETNYAAMYTAKLIFPSADIFENEEYIKEYVKNSGELWSFDNISVIRDGGTIILNRRGKSTHFYLHKDHRTLHDGYPTSNENLVTDKPTHAYVLDRLEKYKIECKAALDQATKIINTINFKTTM